MTLLKPLAATLAVVALAACHSGSGSDSQPISAEHQKMIDSATPVANAEAMATCTAERVNALYLLQDSGSFKTCVHLGDKAGYGYADVSVQRSAYEGSEQVLSFHSYTSLPHCGYYTRNLVAYIASSKKLKYCGLHEGYLWWRTWQDVDLQGSNCAITANNDGTKTVTCGENQTIIADGKDGADGQDGADGKDGANGANGQDGAKGPTGADGQDGADGAKGDKGDTGANGADGAKGDKGDKGDAGVDGADGAKGDKGDKGDAGVDGANGADGAKGDKGDKGETGDNGNDGAKGDKGDTGTNGAAGDKGDTGDAGADGQNCQLTENADGSHTLTCGTVATIISAPRPTFVQMGSGFGHTCGLSAKGDVWCWGSNQHGQLGRNLPTGSSEKAEMGRITALAKVKKLASGYDHTCALTEDVKVYCWGQNNIGQIGVPAGNGESPYPVEVAGFAGAKDLVAGPANTCIITADDKVKCIGFVRTGPALNIVRDVPTLIPGLDGIVQLAIGDSSMCGLASTGQVLCRGNNGSGQLAQPQTVGSLDTAAPVPGLSGIQQIAATLNSYCVIDGSGEVLCWGNNFGGEVGQPNSTTAFFSPQQVATLADTKELSGGFGSFCALSSSDELRCWGRNGQGQFGNGSNVPPYSHVPQVVFSGLSSPIETVFTGSIAVTRCLRSADRRIRCWGRFGILPLDAIPTAQPASTYGPWELDLSETGL